MCPLPNNHKVLPFDKSMEFVPCAAVNPFVCRKYCKKAESIIASGAFVSVDFRPFKQLPKKKSKKVQTSSNLMERNIIENTKICFLCGNGNKGVRELF